YVSMAQNLAAGGQPLELIGSNSTYFSPLLPILIAGMSFLVPDFIISGYAVVALFGALMLVPVYLMTREFSGERAALLAAALVAVLPLAVDYSSSIYSEGLYSFFLLMALFLGWRMLGAGGSPAGLGFAAGAGLCLGLAYLANPAAVFYAIALPALVLIAAVRSGGGRKMAGLAAVFLLTFAVFAVPYILFLHSELGRWTYSGKFVDVNLYGAMNNLRLETVEWDRDMLSLTEDGTQVKVMTLPNDVDLTRFIARYPGVAAKIFAKQSYVLYTDLLPRIVPLWLLPLLGLGLFGRGWDRQRAAWTGFLILMMAPALLVLSMYAHGRFFMPYLALSAVLMGAGWQQLEDWGRRTLDAGIAGPWKKPLARCLPWLIGAAVLLPTVAYAGAVAATPSGKVAEFREAGEWLKENAGEGKRIMSRESPSSFYAGGIPHFLPYADYQDMTGYARYHEIDYMVLSRQMIFDLRPQLKVLLEDDAAHPEWRLVKAIRPGTPRETLIFRLEPE
ncbi:MAG: glycosyltransferase family 39 protein, partial [Thermoleophilia bacterium]|nr:glycosyltransferase family 39 protein [Thermoleophilia bacterium]